MPKSRSTNTPAWYRPKGGRTPRLERVTPYSRREVWTSARIERIHAQCNRIVDEAEALTAIIMEIPVLTPHRTLPAAVINGSGTTRDLSNQAENLVARPARQIGAGQEAKLSQSTLLEYSSMALVDGLQDLVEQMLLHDLGGYDFSSPSASSTEIRVATPPASARAEQAQITPSAQAAVRPHSSSGDSMTPMNLYDSDAESVSSGIFACNGKCCCSSTEDEHFGYDSDVSETQ